MEMAELLEFTNRKLQEGLNLGAIEQELGFGKDTLRKKFRKFGYAYDRKNKQYVPQYNTVQHKDDSQNITQNNTMSYKKEKTAYNPIEDKNIGDDLEMKLEEFKALSTIEQVNFINSFADGKKNLGEIGKEQFGTINISNIIPREEAYWDGVKKCYVLIEPKDNVFTEDEIMFIKNLYRQSKLKEEINDMEQGEIINRSIRVDKDVIENFAKCCKENNLKQTNALKIALLDFMEKINK